MYKGGLSSFLFLHLSFTVTLEKKTCENFLRLFPFFVDPLFLSYFSPDWQFNHDRGMLRGGSPAASPFSLWRPLELLVEETMQEELEVKDVEFEEDRMEVVW